jgi:CIC family chloride channel protein
MNVSFFSRPLGKSLQLVVRKLFLKLNLSEQHFLVGLAMLVGIGGGFASVAFRALLSAAEHLFGVVVPKLIGHDWLLPVIPAVGALVAGVLTYNYAREAKGHGVPNVMEAIITKRGIIRARVVVVKAFASAFTLGTGGSAGSEGPIIQIGSAWGSSIGQLFRISEANTKTLIACGAAAGISAIFNAPIAGVLFAIEIILGEFTISAFTPVVISSVLSAVVAQGFIGDRPVFLTPDYHFSGGLELFWFVVLAVMAGGLAVAFIKLLYGAEDYFDLRATYLPEWVKPAVGGGLVGAIGLYYPEVLGVGYETIEGALNGGIGSTLLLTLLGLKLVATGLTLGSGGSGGVFAPSLFFGAALGGAFGSFAGTYLPGVASPAGAFALVGMGAMVSATTHAPLTAMLIIFEMTGSYHIILPLMFATIIALITARSLETESIYSLKLSRRGIRAFHGQDLSALERVPVSRIMKEEYTFVRKDTSLGEIVSMIQRSDYRDYPVLDESGVILGMVWFHDVREVMLENSMYPLLVASDIQGEIPTTVHVDSSLAEALLCFSEVDAESLPVVMKEDTSRIAGLVTRTDLMRFYERVLLIRERTEAMAASLDER